MSGLLRQQKASSETERSWLDLRYNDNGTIKKLDELENELRKVPEPVDENILDRVQGSIIGMALGDAVGAHVEFRPKEYLEKYPVKDLKGGGTWGLEKGQFTDDTSMALCLANSLVTCRDFIPYDQLVHYKWWYKNGYMSSTGKCFDIGAATKESLDEFEHRQIVFGQKYNISLKEMDFLSVPELLSQFNVDCSKKGVAGNGALMRLAPVPLFFHDHPEYAIEFSGVSGRITHGDQIAYDACRYYGALIVAAITCKNKDELLDKDFYSNHKEWFNDKQLHPDIQKIAGGSYKRSGGYSAGIRGKGYIVHALEAALWAFRYDENSFEKGVLSAVNLGDDTDTTAAIYGQLAGAFYGYKKLPKKWLKYVYAQRFIQCLSEWIVYEGQRWQPNKSHLLIMANSSSQQQSNSPTTKKSNAGMQVSPNQSKSHNPSRLSSEEQVKSKLQIEGASQKMTEVNQNNNFQSSSSSKSSSEIGQDRHVASNHPNSTQYQGFEPLSGRGYFDENLKTYEDVGVWLESIGKEYATYRPNFEENMIDGFWLLNYVNEENLLQYGVKNKKHRQELIARIEGLKKQIST